MVEDEQYKIITDATYKFWLYRMMNNRIGSPGETFYQPMYTDLMFFATELREFNTPWWLDRPMFHPRFLPACEIDGGQFDCAYLTVPTRLFECDITLVAQFKDNDIMRGYYGCIEMTYRDNIPAEAQSRALYVQRFKEWDKSLDGPEGARQKAMDAAAYWKKLTDDAHVVDRDMAATG